MKSLSLIALFCVLFSNSIFAQNVPIDFEPDGNGANWNWRTFENDTNPPLEIIDNPDPSGLNMSNTVLKFTALRLGQPFAGFESMHGTDIGDFVITEDNAIISIMVWKTVISDVGIKLVRADNWSLGEIKIANTKINEWEKIDFDFSDHIGNPYDQIVVFPDFNNRQDDQIIYIDNIYGDSPITSSSSLISEYVLTISPNPAQDFIELARIDLPFEYKIYSVTGQQIETSKLSSSRIDVSNLSMGLYSITVITERGVKSQMFYKI